MTLVVVLPSRNEPATIAAVATAADTAVGGMAATIVHADSSDTRETAERFRVTSTQATKIALTGLVRGKGAQILAALHRPETKTAKAVLIADTDTINPDPSVYRALLDRVEGGAALAIANYPRYWDEANLTNHFARPLIAAVTGYDIPQPLAGDIAISSATLASIIPAMQALPEELRKCADGYGIDAFLLLTGAGYGPVVSVEFGRPKLHASSFPHLPAIYDEAAPTLLHLAASWVSEPGPASPTPAPYRMADRMLAPARRQSMLTTLDNLGPYPDQDTKRPWPLPVADAWHAVKARTPATVAARQVWPHYLLRVRDWLTSGQHATPTQRAQMLAAAHTSLHAALATSAGAQ